MAPSSRVPARLKVGLKKIAWAIDARPGVPHAK